MNSKDRERSKHMREKTAEVFSIAKDNAPVPGCTISKEVSGGVNSINYFSLAKGTDISAEIHPYHKFILVADGTLTVYGRDGWSRNLQTGDVILTQTDVAVGMRTDTGAVYTELQLRKEDKMNEVIKAGEVFKLADLIPYQDGKIINMDIVHNDKMKFVIMAFDAGTGLAEHAAPGEALIFALDGEAVIVYEGKEHRIRAGENFHFAKGGLHAVKADKKFKMALLLTL
jgi:quercetin dioxygenase-like cupin family protein